MSESSLYPAVKTFLESRGYTPKGEVAHCDVVALRGTQVAIAELKLTLNLDLILQAVDRLAAADEVWLAIPATSRGRDRDPRARKLCRLLGLGLLAIHPRGHTEILAEPGPYTPRKNPRRRRAITKEHATRQGDPSPGGTQGTPIMTAYRQEALACATRLRHGPLPTRALSCETPRATTILYRNVYGWFERISRGTYGLTPKGTEALESHRSPTCQRAT